MSRFVYFYLFLVFILVTPVVILDYMHIKDVRSCADLGGVNVSVGGKVICTDKEKIFENVLY